MSRVLPKELRTRKLKSLPDELSKIAEELLADKFGIEEEVVPEVDDFFLDPRMGPSGFTEFRDGPSSFRDESRMAGGRRDGDVGYIQVREQPWSRTRVAEVEITYPSWDNILKALREMDMQNIRSRRPKELVMHPEFYHFFMRSQEARIYFESSDRDRGRVPEGAKDVVGRIAGCEVIVTPRVRHCMLIAEF